MKKIKLFGTLLLLLPGIASCDGLSDTPGKEEEKEETPSGLLDDLNTNINDDNTDNKTSDEKKEEPNAATKYLITFYNGSVKLAEVEKPAGTYSLASIYTGNTPTKEGNTQYSYSFKGWSTSSTSSTTVTAYKISKDTPFYAVFNENLKEYNITWKNFDGSTLATTTHKYGTVPSYSGATPTGPKDTLATYTFKGWAKEVNGSVLSPLPVVTKADTYYAVFESTINVTKETLKADTRKLTAKGDGYTYLDYNLEEKYMSWADLVSGGYISKSSSYINSISSTLDSLGKGVLQIPEDSNLDYSYNDSRNMFENCELVDGVNVPAVIKQNTLKAFAHGCTSIRTVNFLAPKSGSTNKITAIGNYAFQNCTNLESVVFSNPNITSIGMYAFQGCTKLKTVTLPNKLEIIYNLAFESCSSLGEISLPSSLQTIKTSAFANSGISKVTVTSTVTLESSVFEGSDIASVIFSGSNAKLKLNGHFIFRNCESLNTFNFSKIEWSEDYTYLFANTGFTSVDLSSISYTYISPNAFEGCKKLTSVSLKTGITTLHERAFADCVELTTVTNLVSSATIKDSCFVGCSKLNKQGTSTTLTLTNATLEDNAFAKTSFTKIVVSAKSLGSSVFSDMGSLTNAELTLNTITVPTFTFNGCTKLEYLTINVPYDNTAITTISGKKVDQNDFILQRSGKTGYVLGRCNALKQVTFSGTVDQFMMHYKTSNTSNTVDTPLRIWNNSVKIICKKGCVKDNITSSVTLSSSNFVSYAEKFNIAWAEYDI